MTTNRTAEEHEQERARGSALLHADTVPKGERTQAIMAVMYLLAEDGHDNHTILVKASELGARWGRFTGANLFEDWTRMLAMLRKVRAVYPNPDQQKKADRKPPPRQEGS